MPDLLFVCSVSLFVWDDLRIWWQTKSKSMRIETFFLKWIYKCLFLPALIRLWRSLGLLCSSMAPVCQQQHWFEVLCRDAAVCSLRGTRCPYSPSWKRLWFLWVSPRVIVDIAGSIQSLWPRHHVYVGATNFMWARQDDYRMSGMSQEPLEHFDSCHAPVWDLL